MIVVKNDRCQKFKPEISSTLTETSSSEKAAITFQVGITRKHYFANQQIEVQDNMTRLAIYPETLTSTSLIRLAEQLCSAVYTHRHPQTCTCTTVYSACACASMLHIVVLIHSRFITEIKSGAAPEEVRHSFYCAWWRLLSWQFTATLPRQTLGLYM